MFHSEIEVIDWTGVLPAMDTLRAWGMMYEIGLVAIEDVHIMPGDSKRSGASFMRHLGAWHAILELSGLPWVTVRPQTWMKGLVPAKQTRTDKPSVGVVQRMFPGVDLAGPRGGVKDGRADAVLIALWASKQVGGRGNGRD